LTSLLLPQADQNTNPANTPNDLWSLIDMPGILVRVRLLDIGRPIAVTMIDASAPGPQQLDIERSRVRVLLQNTMM
jgi:tRNA(Met) C34 N-acetyltransferase TmcA